MSKGEPTGPADEGTMNLSMPSFSQLNHGGLATQGPQGAPRARRDRRRSRPMLQRVPKLDLQLTTRESIAALSDFSASCKNFSDQGNTLGAIKLLVNRFESLNTTFRSCINVDFGNDVQQQVYTSLLDEDDWVDHLKYTYMVLRSLYKVIHRDSNTQLKKQIVSRCPDLLTSMKTFLLDFLPCFRSSQSPSSSDESISLVSSDVRKLVSAETVHVDSSQLKDPDQDAFMQKKTVVASPGQQDTSLRFQKFVKYYADLLSTMGYEYKGVLGKGGMGVVLKAYKSSLDTDVAVKICLSDTADTEALSRLKREGRAMVKLSKGDPVSITPVYDLIEIPSGDLMIVMGMESGPTVQLDRDYSDFDKDEIEKAIHTPENDALEDLWMQIKLSLYPDSGATAPDISFSHLQKIISEAIEPSGVLRPYMKPDGVKKLNAFLHQNESLLGADVLTHDELREVGIQNIFRETIKPAMKQYVKDVYEALDVAELDQGVFEGSNWYIADRHLRKVCEGYFPSDVYDQIFLTIAQSLIQDAAYINRSGFLHRDHKPSNFILTSEAADVYITLLNRVTEILCDSECEDPTLDIRKAYEDALTSLKSAKKITRIMDFGLVKDISEVENDAEAQTDEGFSNQPELLDNDPELTEAGAILGTPLYMTISGVYSQLSKFTDMHAICVCLIEQYTGQSNPMGLGTESVMSVITSLGMMGASLSQEKQSGKDYIPYTALPLQPQIESYLPKVAAPFIPERNNLSVADKSEKFFNHWREANPRVLRMFRALSRIQEEEPQDDSFLEAWDFAESELADILKEPLRKELKIAFGSLAGIIAIAFMALLMRTPDKVALAEFEKEKQQMAKKADELEKNLSAEELAHKKAVADKKAEVARLAAEAEKIKNEKNQAERKRQVEDFLEEFDGLKKLYSSRDVRKFRKEYEELQEHYVKLGGTVEKFIEITQPMRNEMYSERTLSSISYEVLKYIRQDEPAALQLLKDKKFDEFCKQVRENMKPSDLKEMNPSDFEILLTMGTRLMKKYNKWITQFEVSNQSTDQWIENLYSSPEYLVLCELLSKLESKSNLVDSQVFTHYKSLSSCVLQFLFGMENFTRNVSRDSTLSSAQKLELNKVCDRAKGYYNGNRKELFIASFKRIKSSIAESVKIPKE